MITRRNLVPSVAALVASALGVTAAPPKRKQPGEGEITIRCLDADLRVYQEKLKDAMNTTLIHIRRIEKERRS